MEDINKFKKKALEDGYATYRENLLTNFAWIENFCKENYGKGDYIHWLSEKINLFEENEKTLTELVGLDYIKSNSLNFQVSPTIKSATDFLRKKLLDTTIQANYEKSESRAAFELLKQVRDNLIHSGKFEMEPN